MAKTRTTYVCRSCGGVQLRWMGKCPDCSGWDTLEELRTTAAAQADPHKASAVAWALGAGGPEGVDDAGLIEAPQAKPLGEVDRDGGSLVRIGSGIGELDRVLGGGVVPGSVILLGGDPGIGKSTLLLQAMAALASNSVRTLYVTSEESAEQVRLRAERLRLGMTPREERGRAQDDAALARLRDELWILADTNLARIVEQARRVRPAVLVIDSVQMIYKADLDAAPGSVSQLRRCATELVYLAKTSGVAVVLVGHVTKEGALAGPRLLEHLVDAVLYFEGDRHHAHRVLRGVKNRFGTTLEIGLFEMSDAGLREVEDGAGVVASQGEPRPGSVVCPSISGTRCLLVEMQALTATGFLGAAKRKASGVDANRLAMLIAVLEQHGGLRLADRDVFASSVGGVKVVEPAADLALALAIAGSHYKRTLPTDCAAVGEVGLGGEIRPVSQIEHRAREAARLGYKTLLVPAAARLGKIPGVTLDKVKTVSQAIERLG